MTARADVATSFVVAVNEYPSGTWGVGHINITFLDHGVEAGTFGFNSQGRDLKGRFHPQGRLNVRMPGGVFPEAHLHATTHYVIVSQRNYFTMLAYARLQAQLSTDTVQTYGLLTNNCSDFAYRVFAHSDLPEQYRNIASYLHDKREPVAIYTDRVSRLHTARSQAQPKAGRRLEHDLIVVRLIDDALLYWPPLR